MVKGCHGWRHTNFLRVFINRIKNEFAYRGKCTETGGKCGVIMFNEVATLIHLIESTNTAARKQAVRWIVPLKVPRLLEWRPWLAVLRGLK